MSEEVGDEADESQSAGRDVRSAALHARNRGGDGVEQADRERHCLAERHGEEVRDDSTERLGRGEAREDRRAWEGCRATSLASMGRENAMRPAVAPPERRKERSKTTRGSSAAIAKSDRPNARVAVERRPVARARRETVIIHAEQGVGDTLQFARFIPLAGALARVVVACPPSLKVLLETLPNVAEVAVGKPVPRYDKHCPLMSLPAILGIGVERFAGSVPYLRADPATVSIWRERLAELPGPRVGVVWAGNPVYPADRKRSMPFAVLAPLLALPGVSFVSLQMGEAAAAGLGRFAFDAAPLIGDYADTAALMMALDLIISVDTSAAHLAGALGRPVWLLNRADTDWRWLLERSDTPWYPSMRIFRQPVPGDWASVVSEVMRVWGLEAPAWS